MEKEVKCELIVNISYRRVFIVNELITKESVDIENKIYEIRGIQVMLDSDLAKLYE